MLPRFTRNPAARLGHVWGKGHFSEQRKGRVPKAVYVGSSNSRNLGDWWLYDAIRGVMKDIRLTPALHWPVGEDFNKRFGRSLTRLGYGLPASGGLTLLGGGTLFGERFFETMFDRHFSPGGRHGIWGTAVKDPLDEESVHFLRRVAEGAAGRRVFLRDAGSAGRVAEHANCEIEVIGDPVISLCRPVPRALPDGKLRLLVSIGHEASGYWGDQAEVVRAVAGVLRGRGAGFAEVTALAMNSHDLAPLSELSASAGVPVRLVRGWHAPSAALRLFDDTDMVIGQRLHSVVPATASGVPSVSLAYRSKCVHFMESMGAEAQVLRTDEVNEATLNAAVDKLLDSYWEVSSSLVEHAFGFQEVQRVAARTATALLLGSGPGGETTP